MILIINRYLASQIFIGLCLAAAVLLPLFSFLDLLEQLDSVGKGTYQTRDAFCIPLYCCRADLSNLRHLLHY